MRNQINKLLLPLKGHYFLWNTGLAPVTPFLSVYAKQLGYSGFIVGIIYAILPVTGMVAKPLLGAIADRYKSQKAIFLSSIVLTAVSFMCIFYVPGVDDQSVVRFGCDYSEAIIDTCTTNATPYDSNFVDKIIRGAPNETTLCMLNCRMDDNIWKTISKNWHAKDRTDNFAFTAHIPLGLTLNMNCIYFRVYNVSLPNAEPVTPLCPLKSDRISSICDIKCDSDFMRELLPKSAIKDESVVEMYQFWLFLAFMIAAWVGQAIVVSVTDAVCFEMLGDKPHKYGHQRMYGSMGWGIFSIIAGLIVDNTGDRQDYKDYTYTFYLSLGMLLLDFIVSYKLKYEQKHISANIWKDVGQLLTDVRIVVFMLWCIAMGMCTGLVWSFLFWLLEELANDMEWIKTLEGIAMAVQCLGGELPFFFLSGWILNRIGHVNCMTMILLTMGVRLILYSVLSDPWWILPIETLNGLTFGLFYATMASYASIVAPPGTETTVQGLVGAVFEGVGVSAGNLIAGYLLDFVGGSMTFRIFGIGALICGLTHAFVQFFLQRSAAKGETKQNP